MPCVVRRNRTVSLLMIENVSLNFDFSSNCHCRSRLGGAITRHRPAPPGHAVPSGSSCLDRLAQANLVAQQEPMRIARDHPVHHRNLVRLDVDA